jgi:outer membrane murein-binding lipoprotein Lpp
MIERRVARIESDVRTLTSLVAKLEAEVYARSTEMQRAIQGTGEAGRGSEDPC